jgi:hypothetical protein
MGGCMGLGLITLGHVVGWCLSLSIGCLWQRVPRTPLRRGR